MLVYTSGTEPNWPIGIGQTVDGDAIVCNTDIPPLCIPYKITWECFGSVGADFKPVGIVGMNTAEGQADSTC